MAIPRQALCFGTSEMSVHVSFSFSQFFHVGIINISSILQMKKVRYKKPGQDTAPGSGIQTQGHLTLTGRKPQRGTSLMPLMDNKGTRWEWAPHHALASWVGELRLRAHRNRVHC